MEKNFKDLSRQGWVGDNRTDHINSGSLQRIADATEQMAKNYVAMQTELDRYKRWYHEQEDECNRLVRRIRSMKGAYTKLKNK